MANEKIKKAEDQILDWMAVNGIWLLRLSIGFIFFWFGFQKYFPGISSAEDLATRTIDVLSFGIVQAPYSMPILATWEVLIGLGFLSGKFLRATVILLYAQMAGTLFPLFVFPEETFFVVPWIPTIEGQYIIKNIIIITASMVILAHNRGKKIHRKKYRTVEQAILAHPYPYKTPPTSIPKHKPAKSSKPAEPVNKETRQVKPGQAKPGETKSNQNKSGQTKSNQKSGEPKTGQVKPSQNRPAQKPPKKKN